jgi:hypothetical protein
VIREVKKIEIISRVENGKIVRNRTLVVNALNSFQNSDIVITIQKQKIKRTNNQNHYYFGVIIPLVQDGLKDITGEIYTKEETHTFLKSQFNFSELVNEKTGEIVKIPKSTTDNTTTEMEVYHEQIRNFAQEFLNIKIPLPLENLKLEL